MPFGAAKRQWLLILLMMVGGSSNALASSWSSFQWACPAIFEQQGQKIANLIIEKLIRRELKINAEKSENIRAYPLSEKERSEIRKPTPEETARYSTDIFILEGVLERHTGGKRLLFKTPAPWFDFRRNVTEEMDDLVADPRVYPILLGEKGAWYFGYRYIDPYHFFLPDRVELNSRIDAYNNALLKLGSALGRDGTRDPRWLETHFFESRDALFGYERNVRRFAKDQDLPMAPGGKMFFHDVTVHALSEFFVPKSLPSLLARFANRWFDFMDQLDTSQITPFQLQTLRGVTAGFSDEIDSMGMSRRPLMSDGAKTNLDKLAKLNAELWEIVASHLQSPPKNHGEVFPGGSMQGAFESGFLKQNFRLALDNTGEIIASYLVKEPALQEAWLTWLRSESNRDRNLVDGVEEVLRLHQQFSEFPSISARLANIAEQRQTRVLFRKYSYTRLYIERLEFLEYLASQQ